MMKDNEIIKAWKKILATGNAPVGEHWSCGGVVTTRLAKETYDMLTRQKAEIERLRKETSQTIESIRKLARDTIRDTKSEAIKEFWEKVKQEYQGVKHILPTAYLIGDKVLKEMVGDDNG